MVKKKMNRKPIQAYDLGKEAEDVMTIKSQYDSGEKFNSMPVKDDRQQR